MKGERRFNVLHNMLTEVIREEFLARVGKFQVDKPGEPVAMLLDLRLCLNEAEDGYRQMEVLIFAPMNYVGVYTRETWTVIPTADLGDDDEGPLPGKDYVKGASPWKRVAYHDSCWTESIARVLRDDRLLAWGGSDWYKKVDPRKFELPAE